LFDRARVVGVVLVHRNADVAVAKARTRTRLWNRRFRLYDRSAVEVLIDADVDAVAVALLIILDAENVVAIR